MNFKLRHPSLKPSSAEFAETYRNDPYVNALRVKFGYAMTCHKAQGGEWNTVFVDYDFAGSRSEEFFRWAYTATTRAKERLYAINAAAFSPLTLRKPLNPGSQLVIVAPVPAVQNEGVESVPHSEAVTALKPRDETVRDVLLRTGLKVVSAKEHDNHFIYELSADGETARAIVYFRQDGTITRWRVDRQTTEAFGGQVSTSLESLAKARTYPTVPVQGRSEPATEPQLMTKAQAELCERLTDAAHAIGIEVCEHRRLNPYTVRFHFRRGVDEASIDYTLDKHGRLTHIQPIINRCSSLELLRTIQDLTQGADHVS